jgi:hypothetical protein
MPGRAGHWIAKTLAWKNGFAKTARGVPTLTVLGKIVKRAGVHLQNA